MPCHYYTPEESAALAMKDAADKAATVRVLTDQVNTLTRLLCKATNNLEIACDIIDNEFGHDYGLSPEGELAEWISDHYKLDREREANNG